MPIVRDKADYMGRIDMPYQSANRKVTATPVGSLVPAYQNELIVDTTARQWWRATDLTNTGWVNVLGPDM